MRNYLNDIALQAAELAHARRPDYTGGPGYGAVGPAVSARIAAAIYADVRDAFELDAPWLRDRAQLTQYLTEAHDQARNAGFHVATGPELADMVIQDLTTTSR